MSQVSYGSITITDATDGVQSALIYLYQESATTPSVPSETLTYDFSTNTLSGELGQWQQSTSGLNPSNTIWLITAMALSSENVDSILSSEWSEPRQVSQSAGQDGQDGLNQATVFIYKRGTTATTPTEHPRYTFATGNFTPPNGWYKSIPAADGNPCFVTAAVVISRDTSALVGDWATPTILAQDGVDGISPTVSKEGSTVTITDAAGNIVTVTDGASGTSYYTHIRYADSSTGANMSSSPTGKTYVGMYSGTSQTAPATASSYTWSKYVGNQGVSITAVKEVYYHTTGSAPAQSTLVNGTPITSTSTAGNVWTTVVPTYITGGKYYTSLQTSLSDGTSPVFSTIILNQGLTDSNYNAAVANSVASSANENALGAMSISRATQQHFWFNSTTSGTLEAGAYITDTPIDTFKNGKAGGYLLARSDGLELGKGTNKFMTLDSSALKFYNTSGTVTSTFGNSIALASNGASIVIGATGSSNSNVYITSTELQLRRGTTANATLNSSGLILTKGGIEAGTKNSENYIYLWTHDDATNHTLAINNSGNKSDWRIIAGNKFGVDKAGNLYASNATITGKITVSSGSDLSGGLGDYSTTTEMNGAINSATSAVSTVANKALSQSTWYATCSTAAATTAKVATITPTTTAFTLSVGATVNVKFTATNSGAVGSITLNVNNTGAKNIKYINNNAISNIPAVGYIIANATYQFVYDGTYWVIQNLNYNSDTVNRTRWQNDITAATAITAGHIICGTASGYKNIAAGVAFDMAYPLLYAASAITAAAVGSNNFLEINGINAANNGTITSGAANKILYLKGTISGNTFTISASPFMTTVVPASQDNICYIPLGIMYPNQDTVTNIYFKSSDQIYAYKDGAFGPISLREASGAAKTATNYITNIDSNNGITIKAINGTTDTNTTTGNYIKLNASGLYIYKGGVEQAYFTGSAAAIGRTGQNRIIIDSNGLTVYKYISSTQTNVANFGETARIGVDGKQRLLITSNGVNGYTYNSTDGAKAQLQISPTWNCFGDPSATRITMGWSGDPYVYMNAGGKAAFNVAAKADGSDTTMDLYANGVVRTKLNKAGIHLYDENSKERILIDASGMTVKNSSGTTIANFNSSITLASNGANVTVGQVAADKYNAYITTSNFQIRNNTTAIATFGSSISLGSNGATVTIGQVAADKYNAYITTSGFSVRKNATAIATFGSSITLGSDGATVTIGKTGTNSTYNTVISSSGLTVNDNATSVAQFGTTTRIGKLAQSHVEIAPTSILMNVKTTTDTNPVPAFKVNQLSSNTVKSLYTYNRSFPNGDESMLEDVIKMGKVITSYVSLKVKYKINNGNATTDTYNDFNFSVNKKYYFHAIQYSGYEDSVSIAFKRGDTATSSETITLISIEFTFITGQTAVEHTLGAYSNETQSGILRVGNGNSASDLSNAMLLDWNGTAKFSGDIIANCNSDSSGGLSLIQPIHIASRVVDSLSDLTYSYEVNRLGRVITFTVKLIKYVPTSAGANLMQVSVAAPRPYGDFVTSGSFFGRTAIGLMLYTNASDNKVYLRVRNASNTTLDGFTDELWGSLTYITSE